MGRHPWAPAVFSDAGWHCAGPGGGWRCIMGTPVCRMAPWLARRVAARPPRCPVRRVGPRLGRSLFRILIKEEMESTVSYDKYWAYVGIPYFFIVLLFGMYVLFNMDSVFLVSIKKMTPAFSTIAALQRFRKKPPTAGAAAGASPSNTGRATNGSSTGLSPVGTPASPAAAGNGPALR